ncbi:hydrogenase formation protein HypD [Beggiatoa leptomitoformis]|uniref:Hydrogenase maturation factor n=1 Tax=Beggiatoa leptomitoformis TaxID=288004 RepID=A0A2N9YGV7_9GAMM|nr:hydrogenase formation protein HypD [Beggiatoa leptomitoformis]ALG68011.1 hydrogenase formation protein HypD [Beggiatoa leptomitoformis]AUI69703.1 hydrogenase formation protein HypD [Beggiatoa leptomitoformis]
MSLTAQQWLEKIRALPISTPLKIMNICGGHERSITAAGIRGALPPQIELIPGPGCPVCICPEEDIYAAIQLALRDKVILVAFGDMLRVPINVSKTEARSLEQAKALGGDIRPIASPMEALHIAQQNREKPVVFFAAGFETTMAPVAALLAQGIPDNLYILLSGRLTYPAVAMLLETKQAVFHALVAPGHVATIMGAQEWAFIVTQHQLPCAIAGFTPESLLAAFYSTLRQYSSHHYFLDNCYPQLVTPTGNQTAQRYLIETMDIVDANWRGIGIIPHSGFALKDSQHDARLHFPNYANESRLRAGQMPAGCDCASVVLGKIYPNQCRLYGTACAPRHPIGPCMVSDEGACRIWWSGGVRQPATV